jgi:hypothetical protein
MRYEYAIRRYGGGSVSTESQPARTYAESSARLWVASPLRTGIRKAEVLRRPTGGLWRVVSTYTTPESAAQ